MARRAPQSFRAVIIVTVFLSASVGVFLLSRGGSPSSQRIIRVATHVWPGYASLYLARETGSFEKSNLRLIEMVTGSESVRGLRSGALEAACLTLDETLRAQAGGVDLRIVAVLDFSVGGDAIVGRSGIASITDLKGNLVGAEQDAVGILFLARVLRSGGLTLHDVRLYDLQAHEHEQALLSGRLDAVVTYEPRVSHLVQRGAKVLGNSATIPGEVIDVLVVKANLFKTDPVHVKSLVCAVVQANSRLVAGEQRESTARVMGLTLQDFEHGLREVRIPSDEENRMLVLGKSAVLATSLRVLAQEMVEFELLKAPVQPDKLLVNSEEARALPW